MISVIVPMFNSEETIENALNSVLNQTKVELINSIIVVDDGSIDDSYEIVSKYKKEHTIIPITLVKQSNQGVSGNCNSFLYRELSYFLRDSSNSLGVIFNFV